jgi:hypothetical protein
MLPRVVVAAPHTTPVTNTFFLPFLLFASHHPATPPPHTFLFSHFTTHTPAAPPHHLESEDVRPLITNVRGLGPSTLATAIDTRARSA